MIAPKIRRYSHPEDAEIQLWVEEYESIGQYLILDIPFYIRPITRGEHKKAQLRSSNNESVFEDALCDMACLWPLDYDFYDDNAVAGINTTLSQHILDISGFTQDGADKYFAYWQEKSLDQDERQTLLILQAFPSLRLEDLEKMTISKFAHYVSLAEFNMRIAAHVEAYSELFKPGEIVSLMLMPREEFENRLAQVDEQIKELHKKQNDSATAQRAAAMQQQMGLR